MHGIPWFAFYQETTMPLKGSNDLRKAKTVTQLGKEKRDKSIPQVDSVEVTQVTPLGPNAPKNRVVEWDGDR